MVLEAKGKIVQLSKNKLGIYIPVKIHSNSKFPFKPKQDVNVGIDRKKLIVEPYE